MKLDVTQREISALVEALPGEHPLRTKLEPLLREASTLRVLAEIGPAGADEDARKCFDRWAESDVTVYPSEADARAACPRAFKDVCTEWGRAGHLGGSYPLADGRTVRRRGIWWDVPEPGGKTVVYFFAD